GTTWTPCGRSRAMIRRRRSSIRRTIGSWSTAISCRTTTRWSQPPSKGRQHLDEHAGIGLRARYPPVVALGEIPWVAVCRRALLAQDGRAGLLFEVEH